ncbi:GNAT family N-acetyltransferase [Streptomyces sp. NPDC085927]|uniref:GNAT family N-acetyltransferase n=1 Tax=Streptomyces sp. NPDC085927 TaxID=3365738 RepID=UPI0037D429CE
MHTTPTRLPAGTLTLRPWSPEDSAELAELYRDEALRRWTSEAVHDEAGAARWVTAQQRGREAGDRFSFAVEEAPEEALEETPAETRAPGTAVRLVGNVVLKYAARGSGSAEVGYWTAARARGRGVAPRALRALTGWAFTAFAHEGLTRLELLHQVDNVASCRVAEKAGFTLAGTLPAAPPAFPLDGHAHVRHAPTAA